MAVGEPVTVTVARRVAPGREAEFEQWSAELTRRAARFPGFLGAGLLRPGQFALPGRTAPAPPRWKMFLVSLAAIYVLQLLSTSSWLHSASPCRCA